MKKTGWLVGALVLLLMNGSAFAVTLGFEALSNNSGISGTVAQQLFVDVTANGTDKADFKFYNAGPIVSTIALINFDDGTLLGLSSITDSGAGVAFTEDAPPNNLPEGNTIGFTSSFGGSADSPAPQNGVNQGGIEFVTFTFSLIGGNDFDDLMAAIDSEALRIGLHVISIVSVPGTTGRTFSDAFVNTHNGDFHEVPEPTTLLLLGSGLLGLGMLRRRKIRL